MRGTAVCITCLLLAIVFAADYRAENWNYADIASVRAGLPKNVRVDLGEVAVGLSPPLGIGIGMKTFSFSWPGSPACWAEMGSITGYFVPYARWVAVDEQGRGLPQFVAYASFTVNSWLAGWRDDWGSMEYTFGGGSSFSWCASVRWFPHRWVPIGLDIGHSQYSGPSLGRSSSYWVAATISCGTWLGQGMRAVEPPRVRPSHREKTPVLPPVTKPGPVAGKQPKGTETSKPAFPPKLEARVAFEELGKKNSALDAEEQALIVVAVTNKGKGEARNLQVKAAAISSMSGVSIGGEQTLAQLLTGATDTVRFRLRASEDLKDQEVRFRVSVTEPVFGADALPAVITIATRAAEPPDLVVHDDAITDDTTESEWAQGNGNGQLELNEQVEVTTIIQNKGIGTAYDVSVTVTPTDPNVIYQSPKPVLSLGDIPAGEWRKLQYPIFVNTRFRGDTARLILDIAEQRQRFSRKDTVRIPLNVEMSKLAEVVVQPKPRPGIGPAPQPPSLTDSLLIGIPKGRQNPDAFAVVIGAANYRNVTRVEYAAKDAEAMRKYLLEAFGYLDGNIITLPDPTSGDLNRVFGTAGRPEGQLYNLVSAKPGRCDVFVYYVGHGAPSVKERKTEGYLVPVDASPDYIEQGGYPLDLFYSNLGKVPAKNLTVVLDACFSGETPETSGRVGTLVRDASPVPVASVSEEIPTNSLVMAAAKGNQLACWYPDKRHSLFTYFLLRGLKGEADLNNDGTIAVKELDEYLSRNVPPLARLLYNREQTPEIRGNAATEVLMSR